MTRSRAFTLNKLQGTAAATCLLALIAIALFMIRATEHPGHAVIRSMPPQSPERPETSPYSEPFHADFARLVNNLGRRVRWNKEDTAWLRTIIARPWDDEPLHGPDDTDAREEYIIHSFAIGIVSDRLRWTVETDQETVQVFVDAVRAMLVHPQGHVRTLGAHEAVHGMLIVSPEFRNQVERMAVHDPDPEVRRMARLKLDQHDGLPVDLKPCAGCP